MIVHVPTRLMRKGHGGAAGVPHRQRAAGDEAQHAGSSGYCEGERLSFAREHA